MLLPGLMCDGGIVAPQLARFPGAMAIADSGSERTLSAMAVRVLEQAPPRFALLGHSMGARVALEVLRIAPKRVTRLALVSTGVHAPTPEEPVKRHALRDIGRERGMAALVDAWLPPMVAPAHRDDPALMARLRAMCIGAGLARFEAQIAALLARPEVESLLPKIRVPTLVGTGDQDRWSPPAQHKAMAARIPGARLAIIPGAGHMLPAEAPEALNAAITGWLAAPLSPRHTDHQGEIE